MSHGPNCPPWQHADGCYGIEADRRCHAKRERPRWVRAWRIIRRELRRPLIREAECGCHVWRIAGHAYSYNVPCVLRDLRAADTP